MARKVFILNTTPHDRSGIVTCGFPFDRGEATSTSQIMVVDNANAISDLGQSSFTQRVHWEPFGADYVNPDGSFHSYRYAKIQFRTELDNNIEKQATIRLSTAGSTLNYTAIPYDDANLNAFRGLNISFSMNGQTANLNLASMTMISTFANAVAQEHTSVKRYRLFARPFASMQWIWVEFVVDVPSLGILDSNGNTVSTLPLRHANFWFRYGNSYAERNRGQNLGTYTTQQRSHYLTGNVTLRVAGCDSIMRFENHIYGKNIIVSGNPNAGYTYVLENSNFSASGNNADFYGNNRMKHSTCRNFRGVLFLNSSTTSNINAEKHSHSGNGMPNGLSTSSEITAIAENWGPYLPPNFVAPDIPTGIKQTTRAQKCAFIDNLLFNRGDKSLAAQEPLPFPLGSYGLKAYAPGAGAQGGDNNAFHNYPLYYTVLASYSREFPYMIHSMESHGFRPLWMYEQDGTEWKYENYPRTTIWWTEIHFTSLDYCGVYGNVPTAGSHYNIWPEEWSGIDRQHCSVQLDVCIAILTADYYMLKFVDTITELHAAACTIKSGNGTVDGWEADRASGRVMQGINAAFFASGRQVALRALITRAWMGCVLFWSWTNGSSYYGIDKLSIIYSESGSISDWTRGPDWRTSVYDSFPSSYVNTVDPQRCNTAPGCSQQTLNLCNGFGQLIWVNRRNGEEACDRFYHRPRNGWLFPINPRQTPYINPWQLSFAAIAIHQAAEACRQHFGPTNYSNSRYLVRDTNDTRTTDWIVNGTFTSVRPPSPLGPWNDYADFNELMFRNVARYLCSTVILHCTHLYGYDSPEGWLNIAVQINNGPVHAHQTLARAIECFPVGAVIEGVNSGARARIIALEGGDRDVQTVPGATSRFVNLWLKIISGTFAMNGAFLTENVRNTSTGYVSVNDGGFINNKWFGAQAICIDRDGTGHLAPLENIPGTNPVRTRRGGANYLSPHTTEQKESVDPEKLWGTYGHRGPNWITTSRDFGEWQMACASICLEGLRANHYITRDSVNYSIEAFRNKNKSVLNTVANAVQGQTDGFELNFWPQMAVISNFLDLGETLVPVATVTSLALVQPVVVTAQRNADRLVSPAVIASIASNPTANITTTSAVDVTISSQVIQSSAEMLSRVVVSSSTIFSVTQVESISEIANVIAYGTVVSTEASISRIIGTEIRGPSDSTTTEIPNQERVISELGIGLSEYELEFLALPVDGLANNQRLVPSEVTKLYAEPESSTTFDTPAYQPLQPFTPPPSWLLVSEIEPPAE